MRRGDFRFYAAVVVLVVTIYVVLKLSSTTHVHDFRKVAKAKLQLSTDTKPPGCKADDHSVSYNKRVSVVISTQAQAEAVITQTVNSVLAHIDPLTLEEIIIATDKHLTKDKSDLLQNEFSSYHPIVKILNGDAAERIKNKIVVGQLTTGNVVVFIDDTIVVTSNFLSPLLEALEGHPERIAVPSYDYLTDLTVSVEKSWAQMKWIFGWRLDIKAYEMSFQELASKPETSASPVMVFDTSAFAIHKDYLVKLGSLKHGMDYSSSIELSFATWLCGDGAYVVPCSRVAKIHAEKSILPRDTKTKQMIAERYFTPKYLKVFKRVNQEEVEWTDDEKAELTVNKSFQKKCPKNFDWYMETIVKEDVFVPSSTALAYGYFDSKSGRTCFRQSPAMLFLGHFGCNMHNRGKMVEYLSSGQLRIGSECLVGSDQAYIQTDPCDYNKEEMVWETNKFKQFKDQKNRCISHSTDPYPENKKRQVLMFTDCVDDPDHSSMRWQKWDSFIWLNK